MNNTISTNNTNFVKDASSTNSKSEHFMFNIDQSINPSAVNLVGRSDN
jgi:hypothetical protein